MPNLCFNTLIVRGETIALRRFRKYARGQELFEDGTVEQHELCFERIVPTPPELLAHGRLSMPDHERDVRTAELLERYGWGNWYEFRRDNWGTKWEPVDVEVELTAYELRYDFDTAWSPPRPVVVAASALFPMLSFDLRYSEIECGFRGDLECRAGAVCKDECCDWDPFGAHGADPE